MKQIESTKAPITHGSMPVLNNVLNAGSFRHGSLFSGIGGFDLAAQWMGWENVFHCEWNEFGKKVLNHYWPQAISYDDITKTDFTPHRGAIDVLSGGFPCQPYSSAGKRLGKEDDRHLWPEMLRAIREIKPTWVVGENVYGLVNWNDGLVFHEVQTDLEAEGYTVQPCIIPACAVNAPHRRDRIWFIATNSDSKANMRSSRGNEIKSRKEWLQKRNEVQQPNESNNVRPESTCHVSNSNECAERSPGTSGEIKSNGCNNNDEPCRWGESTELCIRCSDVLRTNANSNGKRYEKPEFTTKPGGTERQYRETDFSSGSESWSRWPTESPICSRNDGFSDRLAGITLSKHRSESLKAYGNAVVPQVVYQIFKTIEQYEGVS
jgi:DNA (cytosine-5)-methyltransferase 1